MARVEVAQAVVADFDRIAAHLDAHGVEASADRLGAIVSAMGILGDNPRIGRPVEGGKRELVIGQGAHGFVALYAFLEEVDTVLVLGLRGQREAGYSAP